MTATATTNLLTFADALEQSGDGYKRVAASKLREAFQLLRDCRDTMNMLRRPPTTPATFEIATLVDSLIARLAMFVMVRLPDVPAKPNGGDGGGGGVAAIGTSLPGGPGVFVGTAAGPIGWGQMVAAVKPPMTRERAVEIARRAAAQHCIDHDYLPKSPLEALDFKPHEWVIDAIRAAAEAR